MSPLHRLMLATGLRHSFANGYSLANLRQDALAGLTVGIIAIPLGMALAIASGVAPQYGLYTSMIAGLVIALTGGSRLSVSGPTAAFVVVLYPITQQFGLGGLLLATLMAGLILLVMGYARLGRLIEYIPVPVVIGFTAGIGIVIATLQIKDFAGLTLSELPASYPEKVAVLWNALPSTSSANLIIGITTLAVLILWPRLPIRLPGHLFALAAGTLVAQLFSIDQVATIGSLFSYELNGEVHPGIPPFPPTPLLPWQLPGADGQPLVLNLALFQALLLPAFSIAMLGAIESLLCAVIADGMSGHRHHANGELIGQGLGNLVAPFFGGITATAAIARTVANYKAGAFSPIAAAIHALVVLAGVMLLAPLLSLLPMAALSALLLMIAWNMSELPQLVRLLKISDHGDRLVLLTTLILTVLVDMVVAVGAGMVLAALVFMQRMSHAVQLTPLEQGNPRLQYFLPSNVCVLKVSGPLFFAGAERTLQSLLQMDDHIDTLILHMDGVPVIDASAVTCLEVVINELRQRQLRLILADLQPQPHRALAQAGIKPDADWLRFEPTLQQSLQQNSQLRS